MSELVVIEDLTISYDSGLAPAVDGVSFTVSAGEVLGLLGGNGAGKTSTMRALAGVQPATSGRILVDGIELGSVPGAEQARQLVGYCPDTAGLLRQGTVREHIALALALHDRTEEWPTALDLAERFDLSRVLDRETSGFSHGMSRRLSVLLAALTAEKVLILDEPFDGVDPLGVQATEHVIAQARDAGLAVIISTHLLQLLTHNCDRISVMVNGRLVESGPASQYADAAGSSHYQSLLLGR